MGKYTSKRSQRCDGRNAQGGGSNRRRKSQENLKKKRKFYLAPHRSPRGLTGAQEQKHAQDPGRPWAPPGPRSAEKIKLANLGFLHPI